MLSSAAAEDAERRRNKSRADAERQATKHADQLARTMKRHAEQRQAQESEIEELSAKSARLDTEIKTLNEEIAQNQEALNKATAIREKELEEFNAEEKDMMQSIQALKNAITVLGKHHPESLVSMESLVSIATLIRHHLHSKAQLLKGTISPDQKRTLTALPT